MRPPVHWFRPRRFGKVAERPRGADALRRKLLTGAARDHRTWLAYAKALVNERNARAAYEAVRNALDLSPQSVEAVQLLQKIESVVAPSAAEFPSRAGALLRSARGSTESIAGTRRIWGSVPSSELASLAAHTPSGPLRTQLETLIRLRDSAPLSPPTFSDPDGRLIWLQAALMAGRYELVLDGLSPEVLTGEMLESIRAELQRPDQAEAADELASLARAYLTARPDDGWVRSKRDELEKLVRVRDVHRERLDLITSGYPLRPAAARTSPMGDRVVYALHESQPLKANGYTARSEYLRGALTDAGWSVSAVTRPGFGWEDHDDGRPGDPTTPYQRLPPVEHHGFVRYVDAYAELLVGHAQSVNPALIHAASNFGDGLAGIQAARKLGVPSVYEMRGLWHLSRAARDPGWEYSDEYRFCEEMEIQAAGRATRVITLSTSMKDWLALRGVSPAKIDVVPNAVDTRRFSPRPRDLDLANTLGLEQGPVFGYAGSIVGYEGLEDLLEALRLLRRGGDDAFAIIAGAEAESSERLRHLTRTLGLEDRVRFVGAVPAPEVPGYYSLCDAVVVPRRMTRVTDVVPPLKVIEPVAMGIPVITTSLPPIVEAVGTLGDYVRFCRPGEPGELAAAMKALIGEDAGARLRAAPEALTATRSWDVAAGQVARSYRRAIQQMS